MTVPPWWTAWKLNRMERVISPHGARDLTALGSPDSLIKNVTNATDRSAQPQRTACPGAAVPRHRAAARQPEHRPGSPAGRWHPPPHPCQARGLGPDHGRAGAPEQRHWYDHLTGEGIPRYENVPCFSWGWGWCVMPDITRPDVLIATGTRIESCNWRIVRVGTRPFVADAGVNRPGQTHVRN